MLITCSHRIADQNDFGSSNVTDRDQNVISSGQVSALTPLARSSSIADGWRVNTNFDNGRKQRPPLAAIVHLPFTRGCPTIRQIDGSWGL